MNDENIKKINQYLYNTANINSEKILESILPTIREAIAKSYMKGFMDCMMNKYKQKKNGNN